MWRLLTWQVLMWRLLMWQVLTWWRLTWQMLTWPLLMWQVLTWHMLMWQVLTWQPTQHCQAQQGTARHRRPCVVSWCSSAWMCTPANGSCMVHSSHMMTPNEYTSACTAAATAATAAVNNARQLRDTGIAAAAAATATCT
jgi:hypothetical protein